MLGWHQVVATWRRGNDDSAPRTHDRGRGEAPVEMATCGMSLSVWRGSVARSRGETMG
jgi:hypothetical protein